MGSGQKWAAERDEEEAEERSRVALEQKVVKFHEKLARTGFQAHLQKLEGLRHKIGLLSQDDNLALTRSQREYLDEAYGIIDGILELPK